MLQFLLAVAMAAAMGVLLGQFCIVLLLCISMEKVAYRTIKLFVETKNCVSGDVSVMLISVMH